MIIILNQLYQRNAGDHHQKQLRARRGSINIKRCSVENQNGRYHCTKSLAIALFCFSTEHLWILIAPFQLSTDDIFILISFIYISYPQNQMVINLMQDLDNVNIMAFELFWDVIKQIFKGDLQTIFRVSYLKVYKLITLGTKFKNLNYQEEKLQFWTRMMT